MAHLFDFIFPKRCVGCKKIGRYICAHCQKTIRFRETRCPECDRGAFDGATHPRCVKPYGLDGLTTFFYYDGIIKKAIKLLKYRFVSDVAETLIQQIPATAFQNLVFLDTSWVIYPIPLHKERLRWRGFNQAEELGKYMGRELQLKLVTGFLTRKYKRIPQADISHREDRIKNAQGLFMLSPRFPEFKALNSGNPVNVLLLDDVWTTGATMKEAAKVLKRHGVKKVWAMTIAR